MFKLTAIVALTATLAQAQFLRDLQTATNSVSGGLWQNGTCARPASPTTDACATGTCCASILANGTLASGLTATTGVCVPTGFAGVNFLV